ncbi:MAG: hypothetical protein HY231_06725 [Acidobacteria bacterium]|nr:hypothetical protein [Acidobacteriota bacterium]
MKEKRERLGAVAAVKGTMISAHLAWAKENTGDDLEALKPHLDQECVNLLTRRLLATEWVLFRHFIQIDRAIAKVVGGVQEKVFWTLGQYSAEVNLGGVYKSFVSANPHRFFDQMVLLHSRFQNFGQSSYEKLSERSARMRLEGYTEYSPAFCLSSGGYYEGALKLMKVIGPIVVQETSCQCAGDKVCLYDLSW